MLGMVSFLCMKIIEGLSIMISSQNVNQEVTDRSADAMNGQQNNSLPCIVCGAQLEKRINNMTSREFSSLVGVSMESTFWTVPCTPRTGAIFHSRILRTNS